MASTTVRLKILAIAEVCCSTGKDELLSSLQNVFSRKEYDELCMSELLDFLVQSRYDPLVIDSVFRLYVKSREDGYSPSGKLTGRIVDVLVRAQLMDLAKEHLDVRRDAVFKTMVIDGAAPPDSAYPYVALLKAHSDTKNPSDRHLSAIIKRMQIDKVEPDMATFNALIATYLKRRQYDQVLRWYRSFLHESRKGRWPLLRPDAYTFRTLFSAHRLFGQERRWRWRNRWNLGYHPWSRELYRHLVWYHLIETNGHPSRPSSVVNPSSLNVALRTFMVSRDYPAAFVVAGSFRDFKVWPNLYTYQVVLRSLMAQVTAESKQGVRSIGIRRTLHLDGKEKRIGVYEKLLTIGRTCKLPTESGGSIESRQEKSGSPPIVNLSTRSYRLPTPSMVIGRVPVSPLATFDSIPLERILWRVIRSAVEQFNFADFDFSPARRIWQMLTQAKRVMIPDMSRFEEKSASRPSAVEDRKYGSSKFLPCLNR